MLNLASPAFCWMLSAICPWRSGGPWPPPPGAPDDEEIVLVKLILIVHVSVMAPLLWDKQNFSLRWRVSPWGCNYYTSAYTPATDLPPSPFHVACKFSVVFFSTLIADHGQNIHRTAHQCGQSLLCNRISTCRSGYKAGTVHSTVDENNTFTECKLSDLSRVWSPKPDL